MIDIEIPELFRDAMEPARYKVWYGGRGSGKSWGVARWLLAMAYQRKLRILCTREFQNSINDSVHHVLKSQADHIGLGQYFETQKTKIICKTTGSEFIFKGLHSNIAEIKSMEGIDICWVEEAAYISEESWKVLIPTIRKEGSEIWVTFNPDRESDPTYQRFVVNPPPGSLVKMINWRDNPWFPETLRLEKDHCFNTNQEAYQHIWEGKTRRISKAIIFAGKWRVDCFDIVPDRYFFGADWGFSQDPTTLIRCFIHKDDLYVDYEAYGVGVEIGNETAQLFDSVPSARNWPIKADNSRPETISAMTRHGFNISPARKWQGSVEDGIAALKSFRTIIVHERCKHTINELQHYRYKTDKVNGEVLPIIVDSDNHCIDALRYSLDGYIDKLGHYEYILNNDKPFAVRGIGGSW